MKTIERLIEHNAKLKNLLFIRGFLITENQDLQNNVYPFYGDWKCEKHGHYYFWSHPETGCYTVDFDGRTFFLAGHAYNPFTMEINERMILKRIAEHYKSPEYFDYIDELTGVFVFGVIDEHGVEYLVDPAGMQSACAGIINNRFYLASHAQLVADLCDLKLDPFVEKLVAYKWYSRVMGCYLPADLSPYSEMRRVVPNSVYQYSEEGKSISHSRFYPIKPLRECTDEAEYKQVIKEGAEILRRNMELVLKKWDRPAISLTGGIDSNTTFAAANGLYDKVKAFSYISAKKETIDAEAAKRIAERFNVEYKQYEIPVTSDNIKCFKEIVAILEHNNGYVIKQPINEYRKRAVLINELDSNVEIKSWVSETIRAYWYKHYGRKSMPKLSAKLYRNLYKIFIMNRTLAHQVDAIFDEYIREYGYASIPSGYLPADLHFNEVTWGSWGSVNISDMKSYADIVIIYNNRRFLDLLLRVPLEKRISDQHHLDMKRILNPELSDMNIRVVNLKETPIRAFLLNIIFTINMWLPF